METSIDVIFDLVSFVTLLITFIYYGIFTAIFFYRRNEQPVKARSPILDLISAIGNFISTICLGLILGLASFNNTKPRTNSITIIIPLIISEVIGVQLILIGYICRAVQLYKIFSISSKDLASSQRNLRKNNCYVLKYYTRRILIVISIFALIVSGIIFVYLQYNDFLYDQMCASLRNFIMIILIVTNNYIPLIILSTYALKLIRQWERQITMNKELAIIIIVWLVCETLFNLALLYYFFYRNWIIHLESESFTIVFVSVMLLLRNFICFTVSIVNAVLKKTGISIIKYGVTRECVEDVRMALSSDIPFLYFSGFVSEYYKEAGTYIVNLYCKLKIYEDAVANPSERCPAQKLAQEITEDLRKARDDCDGLDSINNSLSPIAGNHNEGVEFDKLGTYLLGKLEGYFKEFKLTQEYNELYNQLIQNEVIYERLVHAKLI